MVTETQHCEVIALMNSVNLCVFIYLPAATLSLLCLPEPSYSTIPRRASHMTYPGCTCLLNPREALGLL